MSTPVAPKAKRYNKGGLIATAISALVVLSLIIEEDNNPLVIVAVVTGVNDDFVRAIMAVSGTTTLLLWSFSSSAPLRRWWQAVLAWLGGSLLPILVFITGMFSRNPKVTSFTLVCCFLAFPLLWFGFKRPRQMSTASLKVRSFIACFAGAGIILLSVFVFPAIGSATFRDMESGFGGIAIRSISTGSAGPITYIKYFPAAGILFLILSAVAVLLILSSKKMLLLYIGAAALLVSILHYSFGDLPETGQWFDFAGGRRNIYGRIHGEAWAGLIIGSLLILLSGLVNQGFVKNWLLRRTETPQTNMSVAGDS